MQHLEARLSFHVQHGTEIVSQSLEPLQRVTLHAAQHFLGQQGKLLFSCLGSGRLTLPRAYVGSILDNSFEKLVIFDIEFHHL